MKRVQNTFYREDCFVVRDKHYGDNGFQRSVCSSVTKKIY